MVNIAARLKELALVNGLVISTQTYKLVQGWFERLVAKILARLWQSQGKIQEAYELLHQLYCWFIEGFDTVDMKEVKALLEQLDTQY